MRHLTRPTGVALAAIGIQALMVSAFTAPAVHSTPHRVPLAVSAPAPARGLIEQRLERAAPGAFSFHDVADESAARAQLTDRDAYGAVVVTDQGPHMLVASAAGPTVAALLTEVGSHLAPAGAVTAPTAPATGAAAAARRDRPRRLDGGVSPDARDRGDAGLAAGTHRDGQDRPRRGR